MTLNPKLLKNLRFAYAQEFPFELKFEHFKPLVVLAGYSNVGKSTFINAITGEKVAKISKTPGKTRTINTYYNQNSPVTLIDLPGYGFANLAQNEQKKWEKMMKSFFETIEDPVLVLNLVDARRGIRELDQYMEVAVGDFGFVFARVFNKADELNQSEKSKLKEQILVSVKNKIKLNLIFDLLGKFVSENKKVSPVNPVS